MNKSMEKQSLLGSGNASMMADSSHFNHRTEKVGGASGGKKSFVTRWGWLQLIEMTLVCFILLQFVDACIMIKNTVEIGNMGGKLTLEIFMMLDFLSIATFQILQIFAKESNAFYPFMLFMLTVLTLVWCQAGYLDNHANAPNVGARAAGPVPAVAIARPGLVEVRPTLYINGDQASRLLYLETYLGVIGVGVCAFLDLYVVENGGRTPITDKPYPWSKESEMV